MPVTLLLLALSVTALATGLVLPGVQIKLHSIGIIVASPLNHIAFNIARSTALACDVGIVVALCWLLRQFKSGVHQRSAQPRIRFFDLRLDIWEIDGKNGPFLEQRAS